MGSYHSHYANAAESDANEVELGLHNCKDDEHSGAGLFKIFKLLVRQVAFFYEVMRSGEV